jgi:hypothetical protein
MNMRKGCGDATPAVRRVICRDTSTRARTFDLTAERAARTYWRSRTVSILEAQAGALDR